MWHPSWNGLPPETYLVKLDPLLKGIREHLYTETFTSDQPFGHLSPEWAKKVGLSTDVIVGVGAFDAHMGAVGAGIKSYSLVKIIGTSTCDVLVAPKTDIKDKTIQGICGQVDGSVIPNLIGLEAGQSGFGDVYAWFKNLLMWSVQEFIEDPKLATHIEDKIMAQLTAKAKAIPLDATSVLAIDWLNGRRTPNANQALKGAITGLNLGSDAPRIFRSLVEATAFGARAINECFEKQGIEIKEVIGIGGVAKKSEYVMQILADVLEKSIKVAASDQTCALGAGMCAAVAAGLYPTIEAAQQKMSAGFTKTYTPNPTMAEHYRPLYQKYRQLGDFLEKSLK
jgi:L-ribulokinase